MSLQVAKIIVQQRTDVLLPYARNSRTHSDEQAVLESTGQPFPVPEIAEAA